MLCGAWFVRSVTSRLDGELLELFETLGVFVHAVKTSVQHDDNKGRPCGERQIDR